MPCEELTARATAIAAATSKSRQTRVRTRDDAHLRSGFLIIDDSHNEKVGRQVRFSWKRARLSILSRFMRHRPARRAGQNAERAATRERYAPGRGAGVGRGRGVA